MRLLQATLLLALLAGGCDRSGDSASSAAPSPRAASLDPMAAAPGTSDPRDVRRESSSTTAILGIEGMICESCAQAAQKILEQVEGVHAVGVDFQHGTATIEYDSGRTHIDQLARAVEQVERSPAPPFRVTSRDTTR